MTTSAISEHSYAPVTADFLGSQKLALYESRIDRNNLVVASRRYNYLFIAVLSEIRVFRPSYPYQNIPSSDPYAVLTSDPIVQGANPVNYIIPRVINSLTLGDLGQEEVLVSAHDDGDVCVWYTRNLSRMAMRLNVGSSAWGVALHKERRLLAVSANSHLITVYELGVGKEEVEEKEGRDSAAEETADAAIQRRRKKKRSVPREWDERSVDPSEVRVCAGCGAKKPRNKWTSGEDRAIKVLRGHSHNIPNISFLDDISGRWLTSASIDGMVILWDVFLGMPVEKCKLGVLYRGWSSLFLTPQSFKPVSSTYIALGLAPREHLTRFYPNQKAISEEPPPEKNYVSGVRTINCGYYDRNARATSLTRHRNNEAWDISPLRNGPLAPRHGIFPNNLFNAQIPDFNISFDEEDNSQEDEDEDEDEDEEEEEEEEDSESESDGGELSVEDSEDATTSESDEDNDDHDDVEIYIVPPTASAETISGPPPPAQEAPPDLEGDSNNSDSISSDDGNLNSPDDLPTPYDNFSDDNGSSSSSDSDLGYVQQNIEPVQSAPINPRTWGPRSVPFPRGRRHFSREERFPFRYDSASENSSSDEDRIEPATPPTAFIFATSEHNAYLLPTLPLSPTVVCRSFLHQPTPETSFQCLDSFDRLSMTQFIPDLSLLVAASAVGRVGLFRLTRHEDDFAMRLDATLPRERRAPSIQEQERGLGEGGQVIDVPTRPLAQLLGFAVSPVQGREIGERARWKGADMRRRWRLMLVYADGSILSYELGRESQEKDDDSSTTLA